MSFQLHEIQADLRAARLDGWLFYDFRGRDPIAHRILDLPNAMRTRRWFYFVPAKGIPKKLVHKIEMESLATLPGETLYYSGQDELRKNVKKILAEFEKDDITTDEGPDVAVNAHASDPHYAPSNERPTEIREGDLLLLDVWGKLRFSGSVYYDVAWVGYLGAKVPEKFDKVFKVIVRARDNAVA